MENNKKKNIKGVSKGILVVVFLILLGGFHQASGLLRNIVILRKNSERLKDLMEDYEYTNENKQRT